MSNNSPPPDPGQTMIRRQELFDDRWSSFGSHSGLSGLSSLLRPDEMKAFDLFGDYDDPFLQSISQDVSVADWEKDVVLFEEGSYLDVAFYVLDGTVDVFIQKHEGPTQATPQAMPQAIAEANFDEQRTVFASGPPLDLDNIDVAQTFQTQMVAKPPSKEVAVTFLATMDFDLPRGGVVQLKKGDVFGEIGALNGWPQSVTARTSSACKLVQIRVPALRAMKKNSDTFKEKVDHAYRTRTLSNQLKTAPLFRGLDDSFVDSLSKKVSLISYSPGDVITEQGKSVDALYMIRSGFLRLSESVGDGDMTVNYLSKGMTFGNAELLLPDVDGWLQSTSSVGYSELLQIEKASFVEIVKQHPAVELRLWESAVSLIKEAGNTKKNLDQSELIEFSLQKGLVQGNSMLVIDLDICTRCDDCMRGCADTHGGRPRFVREGDKFDQFMIARSCYHCDDPVCLIGCPTGAIGRIGIDTVVAIEDDLCIGCSNCAMKCPYDAIVMHDTGETWGDNAVPERLRGREKKVASKCDLCFTAESGPACVNNCPHSCAFRIGSIQDFQSLIASGKSDA